MLKLFRIRRSRNFIDSSRSRPTDRPSSLAADYAGLHGSGATNQPLGVANTPSFADVVELETRVANANALIDALAYLTNTRVRGALKTTEKASGTAKYVWEGGPAPLNGHRALVSNQVRSNLGAGGNESALFFANWADLVLGLWSGLDVVVDPYTKSRDGVLCITVMQDLDYAIRHAESFAVALDVAA